jgi:hypothetical protein
VNKAGFQIIKKPTRAKAIPTSKTQKSFSLITINVEVSFIIFITEQIERTAEIKSEYRF